MTMTDYETVCYVHVCWSLYDLPNHVHMQILDGLRLGLCYLGSCQSRWQYKSRVSLPTSIRRCVEGKLITCTPILIL